MTKTVKKCWLSIFCAMFCLLVGFAVGLKTWTMVKADTLVSYTDEQLIEIVADKVAYDIMIVIVQAITFMVLFVLVSLLVKFVSSFLSDTLSKLPVVGKLDSGLGAVFGLLKGCLIVAAVSVLFTIIVATAEANSPLLAIEESYIYGFLKSISPISLG